MARSPVSLIAPLIVAGLILGPVIAVATYGGGVDSLAPSDIAALKFTIWQAALSAFLSIAFAVPVARGLARRHFWGRQALITIMGAPFILPVIVAVLGLLSIFGGRGALNMTLDYLGLPQLDIYGAHGVILAHVFFNLPLAVRLLLQGWLSVPAEQFRLAASLGAPVFRLIEWPLLKRLVPGLFAVIFVLCLGSFAVALTLGGGPRATTIELAIYQAFKFDFDLSRAASLGLVQLALGLSAGLLALSLSRYAPAGVGLDRTVERWDGSKTLDGLWITGTTLFLISPLFALALAGLPGLLEMPPAIWPALGRSLLVALGSSALTLALAVPLATTIGEATSLLGLAVSSLVLGTGIFILINPLIAPSSVALPVTLLVNALLSLPFALRSLTPALKHEREAFDKLIASLGLTSRAAWRIVFLPRLRRPLGFAAGLSGALAMGDLGVITLFARPGGGTLPMEMFNLMARYQMTAAYGAALLLITVSIIIFWICDLGGRINSKA